MTGTSVKGGLDLDTNLSIHIVGIGGAGMRAIGLVLATMGHSITGSDLKSSAGLDRLAAAGIKVSIGHERHNVGQIDLVARSTAVADENIEIREARGRGIPVVSRADLLSAITRIKPTVSVAGTHGKTTTSSMLAVLLAQANLNPSFIIGGEVNEIGCGALWEAESNLFVVEADESDGTFLTLDSDYGIITNVEPDHLGQYGNEANLRDAFHRFLKNIKDKAFVCFDDEGLKDLIGEPDVITYGVNPEADYSIEGYKGSRFGSSFSLNGPSGNLGNFSLATPGLYNVRNAVAALSFADYLGADINLLREGLAQFGGVARRFHYRGEKNGISFIDDYAHLPTEVSSVLQAAKEGDWGRIICVFQPHRYSRTQDFWNDFSHSFQDADVVYVTGIYSAGEPPIPGISGRLIADIVRESESGKQVVYCEHRTDLVDCIRSELTEGDLCLTLGAGDITTLPNELMSGLA